MDKGLQDQLDSLAKKAYEEHGMRAAMKVYSGAFIALEYLALKENDRSKKVDLLEMALDCKAISFFFFEDHYNPEAN